MDVGTTFICEICGESAAYAYVVNGSEQAKYICVGCYQKLTEVAEEDE